MSRVDQLFNTAVNLADLVSQPTEEKQPGTTPNVSAHINESDFSPHRSLPPGNDPEPDDDYDAEQEAKNLVHMLQAGEGLILPQIAVFSFNKKRGGKQAINRMSKAHEKRAAGKELTDPEQKSADAFDAYRDDFKKMMSMFYPEDSYAQKMMEAETKKLIDAAIPYCEATKFHVHSGFAFWMMYAGGFGGKIIKILAT